MPKTTRELLDNATVIAVVGLSDNPTKISYVVARYMQEHGYRIIPVNPTVSEVLGEKAYPSLRDIPGKVDIVNVFRRPADVPPVAEDAIAIHASGLWLQQGITNEDAARKAEAAGLKVVQDCCIMVEHARLVAGL
jgi:predicted CoA-binding protein